MGGRLFGFENGYKGHRPDEAAAAVNAAGWKVDEDIPWADVVRRMNAAGSRTTKGNPWTITTARRALTHPAMAGLIERDGELVDAWWDPILARETWETLVAVAEAGAATASTEHYDYLLTSGGAVCSDCGSWLGSGPSNTGSPGYECNVDGCGAVRIGAKILEEHVAELVVGELLKPDVLSRLAGIRAALERERAALLARVELVRLQQKQAGAEHAANMISLQALKAGEQSWSVQVAGTRKRLRFLGRLLDTPFTITDDPVKWWNHAPVTAQRAVTLLLVRQVVVNPGGRGVREIRPGRVEIMWRTTPPEQAI